MKQRGLGDLNTILCFREIYRYFFDTHESHFVKEWMFLYYQISTTFTFNRALTICPLRISEL